MNAICLNMEYPRYMLVKLHACAYMCVMNFCKKMFIQLFYNETNLCCALQHRVRHMLSVNSEMIQRVN